MAFLFRSCFSKTFKSKKNITEGSHWYNLLKHTEATLGSGALRQAVTLPGQDLNEWTAVNTRPCYGTSTEFHTEVSCLVMSSGPTNIIRPVKCSTPKYTDYLMTWVQHKLDNETFPSKIGVPFPKNFMSTVKTDLKCLRVYAHTYHQHFDSVMQRQEEAHLSTSSEHYRRELDPFQELIEELGSKDR
uniref:MOB kinase activator 1A n=1 Tax=Otolemur garnettii TaxID=30611 RepID=H0XLI4_OTOGA